MQQAWPPRLLAHRWCPWTRPQQLVHLEQARPRKKSRESGILVSSVAIYADRECTYQVVTEQLHDKRGVLVALLG